MKRTLSWAGNCNLIADDPVIHDSKRIPNDAPFFVKPSKHIFPPKPSRVTQPISKKQLTAQPTIETLSPLPEVMRKVEAKPQGLPRSVSVGLGGSRVASSLASNNLKRKLDILRDIAARPEPTFEQSKPADPAPVVDPEPAPRQKWGRRENFVKMNLYKKGAKRSRPGMKFKKAPRQDPFNKPESEQQGDLDFGELKLGLDEEPVPALPPPPVLLSTFTQAEVLAKLQEIFGFSQFRCSVQEETVLRCLKLESCLSVMRTGVGKSLCYQLPAALLPGVVLVITPLISLMKDQLLRIPAAIPAAAIHTQLSKAELTRTITQLCAGEIKILFVSPEKCSSADFIRLTKRLPPILLACVDEAHCLSEWSHNFRSAYIGLGNVLFDQIGVRSVLALTATATRRVEREVCGALRITAANCLREDDVVRDNIHLSCSLSQYKDTDLISLLRTDPRYAAGSVIVYCARKERCEEVARRLRGEGFKAEPYHAGLLPSVRTETQTRFMNSSLRIVCATVAFGMGLNKGDVRNVIHYDMPQSIEAYLQQVGRSGRDGLPAYCHTLLDDAQFFKSHSLAHADTPELEALKAFLRLLFAGSYAIVSATDEGSASKLPPNVVDTLLGQLQVQGLVRRLQPWYAHVHYNFHRTNPLELRKTNLFVEALLQASKKTAKCWIANLNTLCQRLNESPEDLRAKLEYLKDTGELSYELRGNAHCVAVTEGTVPVADVALGLLEQCRALELAQCWRLSRAYELFLCHCSPAGDLANDQALRVALEEYFRRDEDPRPETATANAFYPPEKQRQLTNFVKTDIKAFLARHSEHVGSPRELARIFHRLQVGRQLNAVWLSLAPDWHTYDFNELLALATDAFVRRL